MALKKIRPILQRASPFAVDVATSWLLKKIRSILQRPSPFAIDVATSWLLKKLVLFYKGLHPLLLMSPLRGS